MVGSSWTDSVQGENNGFDARMASSAGAEMAETSDVADDRRPPTDMIISRVIETVRAGVIVTSEALGDMTAELSARNDRLEERLAALTEMVHQRSGSTAEGGDAQDPGTAMWQSASFGAAASRPDDDRLDQIDARLARLEELLEAQAIDPAPANDIAPVWETLEALRHEVMARAAAPAQAGDEEVRAALGEIRETLTDLRQNGSTASVTGDSAPDAGFSAVDDVLFRIDGVEAALRSGLAELADAVVGARPEPGAPVPPDLAPLVDAVGSRLAELRGSLQARLDRVEASLRSGDEAVGAPAADPDAIAATVTGAVASAIQQAMADHLAAIGSLTATESDPQLVAAIETATSEVRAAADTLEQRAEAGARDLAETIQRQLVELQRGLAMSQEAAALQNDAIGARLASLQSVPATTPEHLDTLRDAFADARSDALARHIELQASLQAIGSELLGQLTELRSAAATSDDDGLQRTVAATNERFAELRNTLDTIQATGAEQARDIHDAIASAAERLAGGQADLRHTIETNADNRVVEDAIAATHDRIAELRNVLLGIETSGTDHARDIHEAIAAATDRVAGDIDRLYRTSENGPDLSPVTAPLADLRQAVDDLFHAGGGNTRGLHEAIAAATDRLKSELDQVRAIAEAGPDLDAVMAPLSDIREAIGAVHDSGADSTRGLHDAISAVTEGVADLGAAVTAGRGEAGTRARELQDVIGDTTAQLAEAIDRIHRALEVGPDLSPITRSLDDVRVMITNTAEAVERNAAAPALADLREAVAAVRGTVTLAQQGLAADLAATRETLQATLSEAVAGLAARTDGGTSAIQRVSDQLTAFEHTAEHALEWTEEIGTRVAAIERDLSVGREQWEALPERLSELAGQAGRTSDDISAIAHWTSVHDTPERLEELAATLDAKLAQLGDVVPSLEGALTETKASFERANEGLIGSLDGLRSHLTANGGFTAQSERIREIRAAVEDLARRIGDAGAIAGHSGGGVTAATMGQLQGTVDSLLTRFEERTHALSTRSASLESLIEGSVRQLESQVKDVLTGLGANDRLVRGRFEQLETALNGLRGDVTQIRSLRAEMESLGSAVDDLRNRTAR